MHFGSLENIMAEEFKYSLLPSSFFASAGSQLQMCLRGDDRLTQ
jgi:hypothetical protein